MMRRKRLGYQQKVMPENEIFTQQDYRDAYPDGIELHFWNVARNDLVERWLQTCVSKTELVMDVGCGNGINVAYLSSRGYNARGVEQGDAIVLADAKDRVATRSDLFAMDKSIRDSIRVVLLLDVIEHIADRSEFLNRIKEELPNCQTLLITVPARKELWTTYDENWGHHLRYNASQLKEELLASGFTPERTAYFFHWLYWISLGFKIVGLKKSTHFSAIRRGSVKAILHKILAWITCIENRVVPGAMRGSSLACIAHRSHQTDT